MRFSSRDEIEKSIFVLGTLENYAVIMSILLEEIL